MSSFRLRALFGSPAIPLSTRFCNKHQCMVEDWIDILINGKRAFDSVFGPVSAEFFVVPTRADPNVSMFWLDLRQRLVGRKKQRHFADVQVAGTKLVGNQVSSYEMWFSKEIFRYAEMPAGLRKDLLAEKMTNI